MKPPTLADIRERVVVNTAGCWMWQFGLDAGGYGRIRVGRLNFLAHRVSYEAAKGPIPDGLPLDHLCRVHGCVNPDHLEPVTSRENTMRGDTIPARNAAKTSCDNGHPYDEANTYIRPTGWRDCRTCIRDRVRRYKLARAS